MNIDAILKKYPRKKEYLIEILHDIQNQHPQQYVSEDAVIAVTQYLKIKRAQVYGVLGYYSILSSQSRGKYLIRICGSPVCNMMGSDNLIDFISGRLGIELGQTTPDGLFTLETTECLGNCGAAPAMMVNQDMYGSLTPEKVESILKKLK